MKYIRRKQNLLAKISSNKAEEAAYQCVGVIEETMAAAAIQWRM